MSISGCHKDNTSPNPTYLLKKVKVLPYSVPSVGPGADAGVQAGSPLVGCHYFLAGPAVTLPAEEHHCQLADTKLYCLVTGMCV